SSSITHCGIHDAVGSGNDVAHGTGESGNGSPDAGRHASNGAPDTAARRTDRARCTTVAAASAVAGRTCRAGAGLAVTAPDGGVRGSEVARGAPHPVCRCSAMGQAMGGLVNIHMNFAERVRNANDIALGAATLACR